MNHPLAEVFGYSITDFSEEAVRFRRNRLCPFNNKVPSCTKDKANNPLGVCSIYNKEDTVITCPVRFREGWIIAEDAASFFFGEGVSWTSISEVSLADRHGRSAGHIDIVLVAYDERGKVGDFGSLEVQAVYISGNIRNPFEYYLEKPKHRHNLDWSGKPNYPKPDFLSSSRKRLIPQVLYKGGILKSWGKKQAIALQTSFFETLPDLPVVKKSESDLAWLLYDLDYRKATNRYTLVRKKTVYTEFNPAIEQIVTPQPGAIDDFIEILQQKLDEKLDGNPPDTSALNDIIVT